MTDHGHIELAELSLPLPKFLQPDVAPSPYYLYPRKGQLFSPYSLEVSSSLFHRHILASLTEFISQPSYPCVAALRSVRTEDFRIGAYEGVLGSNEVTACLNKDLSFFIQEQKNYRSSYFSFLAMFRQPVITSENEFEALLWRQLQQLHDQQPDVAWDTRVSSDASAKEFCFSFDGEGIFVVGMHPRSSRLSRVFPFPTLVFNLYQQFEALKRDGVYESMKATNRQRDLKFQGSINPMLTRFGEDSEAVQYSGRDVGSQWQCPFHHGKEKRKDA